MSEIAPQSQSRLSEEFWPPQEDCTARVSAGQALSARVMPRSSFCCFSSAGMRVVVDAMFVAVNCLPPSKNFVLDRWCGCRSRSVSAAPL